jgi:hypothetical protein
MTKTENSAVSNVNAGGEEENMCDLETNEKNNFGEQLFQILSFELF